MNHALTSALEGEGLRLAAILDAKDAAHAAELQALRALMSAEVAARTAAEEDLRRALAVIDALRDGCKQTAAVGSGRRLPTALPARQFALPPSSGCGSADDDAGGDAPAETGGMLDAGVRGVDACLVLPQNAPSCPAETLRRQPNEPETHRQQLHSDHESHDMISDGKGSPSSPGRPLTPSARVRFYSMTVLDDTDGARADSDPVSSPAQAVVAHALLPTETFSTGAAAAAAAAAVVSVGAMARGATTGALTHLAAATARDARSAELAANLDGSYAPVSTAALALAAPQRISTAALPSSASTAGVAAGAAAVGRAGSGVALLPAALKPARAVPAQLADQDARLARLLLVSVSFRPFRACSYTATVSSNLCRPPGLSRRI